MQRVFKSDWSASEHFMAVNGRLIKITLCLKQAEIFARDEFNADIALKALAGGTIKQGESKLSITEATEADLIAVKNANPEKAADINALIKYMRSVKDAEAAAAALKEEKPLRVEIVNASELQKDTSITIHRDKDGKMDSATALKI